MYTEDTIAAIATAVGEGSVAIVRISGPEAEHLAQALFHPSGGKNDGLQSHRLHHGTIRHPKTNELLDEVLVALMRGPRSYTGEDVLEVHCHGGPFVASQILELALASGARHAEAGEFTKRAFLNGRLDLTQAEAVSDLIRARTSRAMRLAAGQVHGELSKWVGDLRSELLDILVQVEAALDFPEEEIDLLQRRELAVKTEGLQNKISAIIDTYEWARLIREGARACLAGRPNVGKSSLLNALLGEDRAIVTPVPGTTRDFIEESLNLDGLPLVLWDTAGICESNNEVERIGIGISMQKIEEAQAVMIVLDGSTPLTDEDRFILAKVRDQNGLVIINKSDLHQELNIGIMQPLAHQKEIISLSAKEGWGISELKRSLRSLLLGRQSEPEIVVTNIRHKAALEKSQRSLAEAVKGLRSEIPPEMVAVDLQETRQLLEEIIGIVTNDDVLDRIFSQFCIGK